MARYDRIARLDPPRRQDAFPGWLVMRDIEGREREAEPARRARLRFLAHRPVRRLLLRGLDVPDGESLRLQIQSVRREVDRLHPRDPERPRLIDYLGEVAGRTPLGLVTATLEMGAGAESGGHTYAAEEFYLSGLELARLHDLPVYRGRALRRLARVHRRRGDWDEAVDFGRKAAAVADVAGEPVQWAMALEEVARSGFERGDIAAGRAVLTEIAGRGQREENTHIRAVAGAGACAFELGRGNADAAVREGAAAIGLYPATDPYRNTTLLAVGSALRRLGLWAAAEECYHAVERRSTWVAHRADAATEVAIVAAERGDFDRFRERRAVIVEAIGRGDLRLQSLLHLGLGRGCIVAGDVDDAREHLRQAITAAREADLPLLLHRAGELLEILEGGRRPPDSRPPRPPAPASRAIAATLARRIGSEVVAAR